MKKNQRIECAKQTVAISESGFYRSPGGLRVDLSKQIQHAVSGTVAYTAENIPAFAAGSPARSTKFEVRNETTFEALHRLAGIVLD